MEKRLGIDVGTNSLGWAIVEVDDEGCTLLDRGVDIFQEGVAREKNQEKPAVQDRTDARALRRHYFRRRLRKIALLRVLVRHDLCPALSEEQLNAWQSKGIYPLDDAFIRWQRTDDNADRNPYRDRFRCLTEELDLACREERYVLGRALYHLCQRRGFLSNRKDAGNEAEEGKVKQEIKTLSADMAPLRGANIWANISTGFTSGKRRFANTIQPGTSTIWPSFVPFAGNSGLMRSCDRHWKKPFSI